MNAEQFPSQERLLDHLPMGVCLVDGARVVRAWNRRMETVTGVAREEVLGTDCRNSLDLLKVSEHRRSLEAAAGGQAAKALVPMTTADGWPCLRQVSFTPIPPPEAGSPQVLITLEDAAGSAPAPPPGASAGPDGPGKDRAADPRWGNFLQRVAPVAVFTVDREGRVTGWNDKAAEVTGYGREEVIGKPCTLFNLPALEEVDPPDGAGPEDTVLSDREAAFQRKDGRQRVASVNLGCLREGDGHVIGLAGGFQDITEGKEAERLLTKAHGRLKQTADDRLAELTRANEDLRKEVAERKRVEEDLRKAHSETEQLLASISSILIGVDEADRIVQWNQAATEHFAVSAGQVLNQPFRESGIPWSWDAVLDQIGEARSKDQPTRVDDVAYTQPDGTAGFLSLTVHPVPRPEGPPYAYLLLGLDVTAQRLIENQTSQAQKLEAMGQLAAGIAHEINTPAQYLQANLDFLLDSLGDVCGTLERVDRALSNSAAGQREHLREARAALEGCDVSFLTEEIPQALEQSREGVATISRIVQAMRHFSRPGTEDTLSAVDLNQTLQSVVTVSRHEWKNVAELHLELDPELPEIDCVAGPINQVLLQILTNAAHAVCEAHGGSGPKGVITIATEHRPPWAVVRISDTGVGMSEEVRSRVFEPFFTTREVGSGSGQGLAVAYDTVVNKHGGSLSVESEPGRGATFEVRLPLREAESGARAAERGRPAAAWS